MTIIFLNEITIYHIVLRWHIIFIQNGDGIAITRDPETSMLIGGADAREESWAEGR